MEDRKIERARCTGATWNALRSCRPAGRLESLASRRSSIRHARWFVPTSSAEIFDLGVEDFEDFKHPSTSGARRPGELSVKRSIIGQIVDRLFDSALQTKPSAQNVRCQILRRFPHFWHPSAS